MSDDIKIGNLSEYIKYKIKFLFIEKILLNRNSNFIAFKFLSFSFSAKYEKSKTELAKNNPRYKTNLRSIFINFKQSRIIISLMTSQNKSI